MSKKVQFSAKPNRAPQPEAGADAWVGTRAAPAAEAEDMKRLAVDIPASLHRAIKAGCAARGTKIADEVRDLLMKHYAG